MSCFSPNAQQFFRKWREEEELHRLEANYQELLDRRKDTIEYGRKSEDIPPRKLAALNLALLQQIQLHRAERLFAAVDPLLLNHNVYGLALVVRGFCETTAIVGYFCNRLESLAQGSIEFEDFAWNLHDAVTGTRHEQFPDARPPPHILTCIEKADRYFEKHAELEKVGVLRDSYDWLSDYAHPNFLSNFSAYTFDKANHRFVLRHEDELNQVDFQVMGYLGLCSSVFLILIDELSKCAVDACLDV